MMKNINRSRTALKVVFVALLLGCCLGSCEMGKIDILLYYKRPKDPALFGEWLSLHALKELKENPHLIEECTKKWHSKYVGIVYHSNGDIQAIYLQYSKNSTKPTLIREPSCAAYYTKDGVIYTILTCHNRWEDPNRIAERYLIKGNLLYIDYNQGVPFPVYEKKKITVDLFPERIVGRKGDPREYPEK